MNLSTPTAAASSRVIGVVPGAQNLTIRVDAGSGAGLRLMTGRGVNVDGVMTVDPDGLLLAVGESITLPLTGAYMVKTATNGTAATFSALVQ
jgi:hypothetical protein